MKTNTMHKPYTKDKLEIKPILITDKTYSWKDTTLMEFLNEGNYPTGWSDFFSQENIKKELQKVSDKLNQESGIVYPPVNQVFRAFYKTPASKVKAVLLGMDPYHNGTTDVDGSAVGLCFSVRKGNNINPSLRNMYAELKAEGFKMEEDGDLSRWTDEGVLMLNTALTVRQSSADSHTSIWSGFTDHLVTYLAKKIKPVWVLMGTHAQRYMKDICKGLFVISTHPSPFSFMRPTKTAPAFMGSMIFTEINSMLLKSDKKPINWSTALKKNQCSQERE